MGEVAPVSAGFQPWIRLVSPTGVLLATGIGTSAVQIAVSAPATGTYTVIVGTNDGTASARNNDTGSYLLTLTRWWGEIGSASGGERGSLTTGAGPLEPSFLGDRGR